MPMHSPDSLKQEAMHMITTPDIKTVRQYAAQGSYDIVPISCEILSDICTPIQAVRKLQKVSNHCFMLESAQSSEKWGRYTFLGFEPKRIVTCSQNEVIVDGKKTQGDPKQVLRSILSQYKSPKIEGLPSFTGGFVGYFAYDFISCSEPSLRLPTTDTEHFKDIDLMLFDKVIAFDNLKQKLILIVNIKLNDPESEYKRAVKELERIAHILENGEQLFEAPGKMTSPVRELFSKEQFCNMVEKAKQHIYEGDIFQIVLSNRLSADFEGSLLNTYRMLRTINPSPYMFYFSGTDVEIAGASPETLVKLENGVLHTFPLAGTRPRGKNEAHDKALERELLADEKELAEHNMLVDLGRNDLGKVSRFGSVTVEKLRSIERFSHVMHIGSTVRGEIKDGCDAIDAISAVLPAGTLSGAPKIRACELIAELENNKRGIYGGAVGYIDFTGNLDTCIAIRIAFKKNGKVFVRSGAGIVADSVAENEYRECAGKAAAVIGALKAAQELGGDVK